jgi:hypothetical protein
VPRPEPEARHRKHVIDDVRLVKIEDGPHNIAWTRPEEVTGRCSSFSRSEATRSAMDEQPAASARLPQFEPLSPILKVARKSRRRSIGRRS